jgi:hypothetical protein
MPVGGAPSCLRFHLGLVEFVLRGSEHNLKNVLKRIRRNRLRHAAFGFGDA